MVDNSNQMVYNHNMTEIILCNLSDANKIINEERLYWVNEVLDALSVPEETYDVSTIDEYRANMDELGIEVELRTSGDVDVYKKEWHEGETEESSGWLPPTKEHLVAQWREPTRIRKVEGKDVYYELHLNEWSILNMRKTNE
ncbi:hypothetical protein LCGC14_2372650 [marine sediment metagenome]|uniref:Uncharacterized protein n=1 Tax=marine sediment metagenome TaxID=412755 RepID=A0A0F9EFP0_9ZZZZ